MFGNIEIQEALDQVRVAAEKAAAEKAGTVVELYDPVVRGVYFKHIREAGNDALTSLGELGGVTEPLLYCECVTPHISDLQAVDDSSQTTGDGSHEFALDVVHGEPGALERVASWPIRVAAVLDFDGDGE